SRCRRAPSATPGRLRERFSGCPSALRLVLPTAIIGRLDADAGPALTAARAVINVPVRYYDAEEGIAGVRGAVSRGPGRGGDRQQPGRLRVRAQLPPRPG